jgi:hypothetical protein
MVISKRLRMLRREPRGAGIIPFCERNAGQRECSVCRLGFRYGDIRSGFEWQECYNGTADSPQGKS